MSKAYQVIILEKKLLASIYVVLFTISIKIGLYNQDENGVV